MVALIFSLFVLKDSFLFFLRDASIDSIPVTIKVADLTEDQDIFLLTEHEIISIDSTLTIKKILPLPNRYFEIKVNKNITLLSSNEALILDHDSLTIVDAIALSEGDYDIINRDKDHLYLLNRRIDTKSIEVYSIKQGKRIRSRTFYDLRHVWPTASGFIIAADSTLSLCSRNLKKVRKIATFSNSNQVFVYENRVVLIGPDSIKIMDFAGSLCRTYAIGDLKFKKGSDIFIGYDSHQINIFRYPDFIRHRFKLSKDIEDIYTNSQIFLKIGNYYRLDPVNRSLIRLKVPTPITTVSDSGYYLQVGAFANPDYAKDLLNQLSARGIPAHSFNGKIRVGPFTNRQDGIDFAQIVDLNNYWVVKGLKQAVTGLLIGKRRYLPIIGPDSLIIYNISDSLLIPAMVISGRYSTYLNQDVDNDGKMDLLLISNSGREIVKEEGDSLTINKEER